MLLKGKRVFLVEDHPGTLDVTVAILQSGGAVVFFDQRGDAVVQKLTQALPIDIILLDLLLPNDLTGFAIFDQIYAVPSFAKIPVVAVTNSGAPHDIATAREKGFRGYICKPLRVYTFNNYIAAILNGESVWMTE